MNLYREFRAHWLPQNANSQMVRVGIVNTKNTAELSVEGKPILSFNRLELIEALAVNTHDLQRIRDGKGEGSVHR